MQGILLIYLYYTADKGGLGMDKSLAGGIVGAYGGSVYCPPYSAHGLPTGFGARKNAVYFRHRGHARTHRFGNRTGFVRAFVRFGTHRVGQRRREIVGKLDGRLAL